MADKPRNGIIPARAGFTRWRSAPPWGCWDHPRSRGVYLIRSIIDLFVPGSSPLARGLLRMVTWSCRRARIIPARAGFTHRCRTTVGDKKDHPRSRGVYVHLWDTRAWPHGSSPLARGLPGHVSGEGDCNMDHPRSRGVYDANAASFAHSSGSSPLARGLLNPNVGVLGHRGIIPARAGFTTRRGQQDQFCPDHPRSRGVYAVSAAPPKAAKGSSPLARGLRVRVSAGRPSRGIIPARAGFTEDVPGGVRGDWDHPRSRGVYSVSFDSVIVLTGSSPLARGLPPEVRGLGDGRWIIPARAGFTTHAPALLARRRDHPRSRGVYAVGWLRPKGLSGSSPLARGLRTLGHLQPVPLRIIPARAGFT